MVQIHIATTTAVLAKGCGAGVGYPAFMTTGQCLAGDGMAQLVLI